MNSLQRPKCLWKLTIDPRGKDDPEKLSFKFCREEKIVGVGWRLDRRPADKAEADRLFAERHRKTRRPGWDAMVHRISEGDHVWVYGDRRYYVCRVCSDWRYEDGDPWDTNDIHNFRHAEWKEVPSELLPGIVRRNLTMPGTAQRITDHPRWLDYSFWLVVTRNLTADMTKGIDFDALNSTLKQRPPQSVFEVLDQDETEDLVGFYLQTELGWRMVKSSTYRSQRKVECQFQRVSCQQSQLAYMQVKSGQRPITDCREYDEVAVPNCWVYLFSTATSPYPSQPGFSHERLICLAQHTMKEFLVENLRLLPYATQLKLALWARALAEC